MQGEREKKREMCDFYWIPKSIFCAGTEMYVDVHSCICVILLDFKNNLRARTEMMLMFLLDF